MPSSLLGPDWGLAQDTSTAEMDRYKDARGSCHQGSGRDTHPTSWASLPAPPPPRLCTAATIWSGRPSLPVGLGRLSGPVSKGRLGPRIHSLCLLGAEDSSGFSALISPSSGILLAKLLDTYSLLVSSVALLKGDMAEYMLV